MIASNPPCLNASSISPKVKAHIKTPEPKAIMAAMTFWLIFRVVPIITPRIKEKPVREAYKKTVAILNIVRNISPAGGEVNDRASRLCS
jgi:hypothetical protein